MQFLVNTPCLSLNFAIELHHGPFHLRDKFDFECGKQFLPWNPLMSNVLGVLRGARLYIAGYAKQSFYHSAISAF